MLDVQFGFRKGRSTLETASNPLNDVEEAMSMLDEKHPPSYRTRNESRSSEQSTQ